MPNGGRKARHGTAGASKDDVPQREARSWLQVQLSFSTSESQPPGAKEHSHGHHRLRSAATRSFGTSITRMGLAGVVTRIVARIAAAIADELRIRRDMRQLMAMDDAMLEDIGLTRAEIGTAVRYSGTDGSGPSGGGWMVRRDAVQPRARQADLAIGGRCKPLGPGVSRLTRAGGRPGRRCPTHAVGDYIGSCPDQVRGASRQRGSLPLCSRDPSP
jgi:uncharacterized protein YjiS (DUF1127 family)